MHNNVGSSVVHDFGLGSQLSTLVVIDPDNVVHQVPPESNNQEETKEANENNSNSFTKYTTNKESHTITDALVNSSAQALPTTLAVLNT